MSWEIYKSFVYLYGGGLCLLDLFFEVVLLGTVLWRHASTGNCFGPGVTMGRLG